MLLVVYHFNGLIIGLLDKVLSYIIDLDVVNVMTMS